MAKKPRVVRVRIAQCKNRRACIKAGDTRLCSPCRSREQLLKELFRLVSTDQVTEEERDRLIANICTYRLPRTEREADEKGIVAVDRERQRHDRRVASQHLRQVVASGHGTRFEQSLAMLQRGALAHGQHYQPRARG